MATKRTNRMDGVLMIGGPILVLLTAMLDPLLSLVLAVGCLMAFGIYKGIQRRGR